MRTHVAAAVLVVVVAAIAPTLAAAQPTSRPPTREEARRHFAEAVRLFARREYAIAAAHFEAAYRTLPHPTVLYNMAQCYERLQQPARAIRHYRRYLADAGDGAQDRAEVERRVRALRALAAEIRIAGANGEDVFVDGRLEGRAPGPLLIDPGRHEIRAGGRRSIVTVQAGETQLVAFAASRSSRPVAVGWIAGIGGLGALGTGWAFFARMLAVNDDLAIAQPDDADFLDRQAAVDDARWPVVGFAAGGAVLTTFAMPFWLPETDGVPWWSWIFGALGLGAGVVASVELAAEGSCIDDACTRRFQSSTLAALVGAHAVPLIAIPVTYLFRALGAPRSASARAWLSPRGEIVVGAAL